MPSGLIRIRAVVIAVALLLATATAAMAHAQLLSSSPTQNAVVTAAPEMAQLMFSEPVTALVVTLIAPDGSHQDLLGQTTSGEALTVTLPEGLGQGTHVLSWRVISVDAHPIGGSLIFSVGAVSGDGTVAVPAADPIVSVALWASKLGLFIGLLFGLGGAVFGLIATLPPAARRAAITLTLVGLIAAPVSLGLHGLDALGLGLGAIFSGPPWTTALATSYGLTVLIAAAALALALLALLLLRFGAAAWLAWPLAGLALSLSGHAGAAEPQLLTRPMVFLHLSGLVFWVGALVPLFVHLRHRTPDADRALADFSSIIPLAVAPILISGAALAVVQMGAPGPQWLAPYGVILAAKLGLLVALLGFAVWNRGWLTKPVLAGALGASRRLMLSVRAEIVLVLLILGLVAGWRFTPPPRALAEVATITASAPLLLHLMGDEDMAMVTVDPGRAGQVSLDISLSDLDGNPLVAESITATISSPSLGIEPFKAEVVANGMDWQVSGVQLPLAGRWQLELDIRKTRFSLVRLSTEFELP